MQFCADVIPDIIHVWIIIFVKDSNICMGVVLEVLQICIFIRQILKCVLHWPLHWGEHVVVRVSVPPNKIVECHC